MVAKKVKINKNENKDKCKHRDKLSRRFCLTIMSSDSAFYSALPQI